MTNQEWARLFRLLDKQGDVYVCIDGDHLIDMRIEKVGRKYVTFRQTYDTGGEPPWQPESVDVDTRIAYDELNGVRFDVY